jgi:hypothetical protein
MESPMSITVIFKPLATSAEQYDEIVRRLEEAGAGSPSGRRFHTCWGDPSSVGVVDVWDSLADFEAFGQILMPIIEAVGARVAEPEIHETHNIIA